MARPRPVFRARSALPPPGGGCARLATLAFAPPPPGGGKAGEGKTNYRNRFTPTKFLPIKRKIERKLRVSIVEVEAARRQNYESLEKAVAQVMPYVSEISKRARLERCLSDYQKAPEIRDSGYLPADLAGEFKNRPADMFSDPEKYIYFLINILESMERIESSNFFGKILGLV